MMSLREVVDLYLSNARKFSVHVALSSFGLSVAEAEHVFSAYEDDYHISRFLHFTEQGGVKISINGFPATHVSIDAEIQSLL